MQRMAIRLGLTTIELDTLWLLVCCEIEPGLSRLARALTLEERPELTVQLVQRLIAPPRTIAEPTDGGRR